MLADKSNKNSNNINSQNDDFQNETGGDGQGLPRRAFLAQGVRLMFAAPIGLSLLGSATGCSSGRGGKAAGGASHNSGRLMLHIDWPRPTASRYIPPYAASLYFEVYPVTNPAERYQIVVNRPDDKPATQTVSFGQLLPVGTYTIAGVARTEANGQGGTVASVAANFPVQAGQTAEVSLTFNSVIKSLQVLGQPLRLYKGGQLHLTGQALDPDGKVVAIPVGGLQWKILSGSDLVDATADGLLTAKAVGTAQIQLIEPTAGIASDPATVEVLEEKNKNIIWVNIGAEIGYINIADPNALDYTRVAGLTADGNNLYLNDIAWSSGANAQLYGVDGDNQLYRVDSTTGVATLIGTLTKDGSAVNDSFTGLTFRSDGRLYVAGIYKGLYIVNTATAALTQVGTMPEGSAGDIAFDAGDNLYLSSSPAGIWRLSSDNASGQLVTRTPEMYGIAVTADKLIGFSTRGDVVLIDVTAGTHSILGSQPAGMGIVSGASNGPRF